MTLTIVKGVANKVQQGQGSASQNSGSNSSSRAVIATASASIANSDATVSSVRSRSVSLESDKVRDPKKARDLADELGEDIRGERELAGAAHSGLDSVASSAREFLL